MDMTNEQSVEQPWQKISAASILLAAVAASIWGISQGRGGAVAFLWGLSGLIVAHEFGHLLMARKSGMLVEEMAFGFGPVLGGVKWRGMRWSLRLIPVGAFVKIAGMGPAGKGDQIPEGLTYRGAVWWRQVAVVAAGPMTNLILAVILLVVGAMGGVPEAPWLKVVSTVGPARAAGLQAGERIVSLNGRHYKKAEALQNAIVSSESGGRPVVLGVEDGGRRFSVTIRPALTSQGWRIGLLNTYGIKHPEFSEAIGIGIKRAWAAAGGVWNGVIRVFAPHQWSSALKSFQPGATGPPSTQRYVSIIGIVRIGLLTGRAGWTGLVNFLGLVSMALWALNLLPISPLDGGHLVRAVGRRVFARKRRLAEAIRIAWRVGTAFGLAAILLVAVSAMWLDVIRPIGIPGG
jgi:regulator of sigma E protease